MNRIERMIVEQQDRAQAAYARIETLREYGDKVLAVIDSSDEDVYWSLWIGYSGKITLHRCMFGKGSIMHDSEVAAELERLEAAFAGDFTSSVDADDGTIRYEMEVPGISVTISVQLIDSGTCRRVVTGYNHVTERKEVEVETAKPIYGIVCGE